MIEKFVHQHRTEVEFEDYSTNEYKEPYVSYTIESDLVRYNLIKNKAFTLNIISDGNIILKSSNNSFVKQIEYSLDNITWHTITPTTSGVSIPVQQGDKVYLKSNGVSNGTDYISINNSSECTYKISGNMLSLIVGDSYLDNDEISSSLGTYTFKNLFLNSTGLTSIDNDNIVFPQNLTIGMYEGTFKGCTSLINTFELIDNIIPDYAYKETFSGCSSLSVVNPTRLYINDIGAHSCEEMFKDCTNLTNINIVLNDCAAFCCKGMFKNCSGITTTKLSELNPTTIYESCYEEMYYGCTNLVSTYEELYPLTLATNCYKGMFAYTNIYKAPSLYAENLVSGCYVEMFYNAPNLNSVIAKFLTTPSELYTYNWLVGVSVDGVFYRNNNASYTDEEIKNNANINYGVPSTWFIEHYTKEELKNMYLTFDIIEGGTIVWKGGGYSWTSYAFEYSINDGSWQTVPATSMKSSYSISVNTGDSISFRGNNDKYSYYTNVDSTYYIMYFSYANNLKFSIKGNLASLFKQSTFTSNSELKYLAHRLFYNNKALTSVRSMYIPKFSEAYTCYFLFDGCTNLKDTPIIEDITSVKSHGFHGMFRNCTSITSLPKFNPTTIGSNGCDGMFSGCSKIKYLNEDFNIFNLNTLSAGCFAGMFSGCSNLKLPNDFNLPYKNLSANCYERMFANCTSLTLPEDFNLPAETLQTYCYQNMFTGCSSLILRNNILNPTATLASYCYCEMFSNCDKITSLLNFSLPYTDLTNADYCYKGMFKGCSKLTELNSNLLKATTLSTGCYNEMFMNCTSLEEIPNNFILPALDLSNASNCYESMFSGCNKLKIVNPNLLPAITLSSSCYRDMFNNCTLLENHPYLLCTNNIPSSAYYRMFYQCTNLGLYSDFILPASSISSSCYNSMFYGCTSINSINQNLLRAATSIASECFYQMFYGCTNLILPTGFILPAMDLTGCDNCYRDMFYNCTSITRVNTNLLPATTLCYQCYTGMFYGCINLENAPELLFEGTLPTAAYQRMFYNCHKINYVKSLTSNIGSISNIENWLYGVASSGTLLHHSQANYEKNTPSGIPVGWNEELYGIGISDEKIIFESQSDIKILTITSQNSWNIINVPSGIILSTSSGSGGITDVSISLNNLNTFENSITITDGEVSKIVSIFYIDESSYMTDPFRINVFSDGIITPYYYKYQNNIDTFHLSYKINNGEWIENTLISSNTSLRSFDINVTAGDIVYFKADNGFVRIYSYSSGNFYFKNITCDFTISGNVKSLFTENYLTDNISLNNYDFYSFMEGKSKLYSAKYLYLPFTILSSYCYSSMFNNCANLIYAPTIPQITSSGERCFYQMFVRCSKLKEFGNLIVSGQQSTHNFYEMFYECNSLEIFGDLNISSLSNNICQQMFYNCKKLLRFNSIILGDSSTAGSYCCSEMFANCSNLTLPNTFRLPALTLSSYCYQSMFSGCLNLELPSGFRLSAGETEGTAIASYCYQSMFMNCKRLTIPNGFTLNSMTLFSNCYYSMFKGCSSLILPEGFTLPAETKASYCYYQMFQNCTSLIKAPIISMLDCGGDYSNYALQYMFSGCSNLNFIRCLIQNPQTTNYSNYPLYQWVSGVAPSGIFIKNKNMTNNWLVDSPNGIPIGWTVLNDLIQINESQLLFDNNSGTYTLNIKSIISFNISTDSSWIHLSTVTNNPDSIDYQLTITVDANNGSERNGNITISGNNCTIILPIIQHELEDEPLRFEFISDGALFWYGAYNSTAKTIEYSKNGGEWKSITSYNNYSSTYSSYSNFITVKAGDFINFRGNNTTYGNSNDDRYLCFNSSARFRALGNLMSLVQSTGFNSVTTLTNTLTFKRLFYNCTNLIDISGLRITAQVLSNHCYNGLFYGCTGITEIPSSLLSTTTLADYCYAYMFDGCTGLTSFPKQMISTFTTLKNNCYTGMFYGCTNITSIPSDLLPASTLFSGCYQEMFGNTGLTEIPSTLFSNVTTLAGWCYYKMFCKTKITSIPSNLLNVTNVQQACYGFMFEGCDLLESIPATLLPSTKTANNCYESMFDGCTSITSIPNTLFSNITANYSQYCFKYMFRGTSITSIYEDLLPNKTLGKGSLYGMFENCKELLSLPTNLLKWTGTAPQEVYMELFQGCEKITSIPNNFIKYTGVASKCYQQMFMSCTLLDTVPDNLLIATSLAANCYDQMFKNCTSLTKTIIFPATTLANYCYSSMYEGCTGLTTLQSSLITSSMATFDNCFRRMFYGCTSLVNLPNNFDLTPASVATNCYYYMFYGCENLVTAPMLVLSSTANNCCEYMFYNCKKLILPEGFALNATTLAQNCYDGMFYKCESMIIPNSLVINNLESIGNRSCLQMFSDCYSITNIDNFNLTCTTLNQYCYNGMFENCTGLTHLPSNLLQCGANGETLSTACYMTMFSGCSSLTAIPNNFLPAQNLANRCYYGMFRRTSLETILSNLLPATVLSSNCYETMFEDCKHLVYVPENLLPAGKNGNGSLATSCYSGMFRRCSNLINIGKDFLPATTLSDSCYNSMFESCKSLLRAPDLNSENGASSCYNNMFNGCSNLNYIQCLLMNNDNSKAYCFLAYVSNTGIFIKSPNSTWSNSYAYSYPPDSWTKYDYPNVPEIDEVSSIHILVSEKKYYLPMTGGTISDICIISTSPSILVEHNNIYNITYTRVAIQNDLYKYTFTLVAANNNNNKPIKDTINITNGSGLSCTFDVYQLGIGSSYTIDLNDEWIVNENINGYSSLPENSSEYSSSSSNHDFTRTMYININNYNVFRIYYIYEFTSTVYIALDITDPDIVKNNYLVALRDKDQEFIIDNINENVPHTITIVGRCAWFGGASAEHKSNIRIIG